jgi:hypothetical protein
MLNAKPAEIAEGALSFFQLLDGKAGPLGHAGTAQSAGPTKAWKLRRREAPAAGRSGNAERRTPNAQSFAYRFPLNHGLAPRAPR